MNTMTDYGSSVDVWVPPVFYDDHVSRDLPAGTVLDRKPRKGVRVALNWEEYTELRSDAEHYASPGQGFTADYFGLISSARSTLKALDRQVDGEMEQWLREGVL